MINTIPLVLFATSLVSLFISFRVKVLSLKILSKTMGYAIIIITITLLYSIELLDQISLTLGYIFTLISLLISVYTTSYQIFHHYPSRLEVLMDLFLVSIISVYIAPSFILMVTAWTISELLGYILIRLGEEHSIEGSLTSSRGFIFTSTLTYEISVFTLITMSVVFTAANIGLYELTKSFTATRDIAIAIPLIIVPLLILGFMVKMANIPLHFWLPSAHSSAPSPASATLSGLMVSLGYYGLYRVLNIVDISEYRIYVSWFFIVIGFLTIVYGGFQALEQRDVKKILAYSTIATNGFVSTIFALYILSPTETMTWALIIAILMHAAYKTTLFCEAGLVEIVYGTRYVHGVRGFVKIAPISTIGGSLAVFSLLGVPGTMGFVAKLIAIYSAILMLNSQVTIAITSIVAFLAYIAISALIALKYARIYYGARSSKIEVLVDKIDKQIQIPILTLGLFNVALNAILIAELGAIRYGYILALISLLPIMTTYLAYSQFKAQIGTGERFE